jgi:hypothetical protein
MTGLLVSMVLWQSGTSAQGYSPKFSSARYQLAQEYKTKVKPVSE